MSRRPNSLKLARLFLPEKDYAIRPGPAGRHNFFHKGPSRAMPQIGPLLTNRQGRDALKPYLDLERSADPDRRRAFFETAARLLARRQIDLQPDEVPAFVESAIAAAVDETDARARRALLAAVQFTLRPSTTDASRRYAFRPALYAHFDRLIEREPPNAPDEPFILSTALQIIDAAGPFIPARIEKRTSCAASLLHDTLVGRMRRYVDCVSADALDQPNFLLVRKSLTCLARAVDQAPSLLTRAYCALLAEACFLDSVVAQRMTRRLVRKWRLDAGGLRAYNLAAASRRNEIVAIRDEAAFHLLAGVHMVRQGRSSMPLADLLPDGRIQDLFCRESPGPSAKGQEALEEILRQWAHVPRPTGPVGRPVSSNGGPAPR